MKELPDKCIDLVLTDPPYNASNSNLSWNDYQTINEKWDKQFNPIPYLEECKLKVRDGGSMIFFCSYHLLGDYLKWGGMKVQQIIHWQHTNYIPAITKVYTPCIEYAVWYTTPKYTFNKEYTKTNVILNNKAYQVDGKINHPSVKPTNLIEKLLLVHSNENELILDCFSGSGSTAIACHNLKRRFICIEKDYDYWKASCERLENAQAQLRLF
jgi:site-specific DNA-methyltransferase (adenine-specific)